MNLNLDKLQSKNLNKLCRLCLNDESVTFPLFSVNDVDCRAIELSMQVTMCTTVMVSKFDKLPKKICISCRTFVREWYKFRRKCQEVDLALKKTLSEKSCVKNITGNSPQWQPSDGSDNDVISDNELPLIVSLSIKEKSPEKIKFSCDLCSESFPFLNELSLHRLSKHYNKRRLRISSNFLGMQKAVNKEPKGVRCKFRMECCGKLFLNKSFYRQHRQLRHPKEKPYACDVCGKRNFISDETLKRHKLLHTGRYSCDQCGRTFTCQAILRIHVRDKHENDRPYVCDVCGKAFVTELLLSYHQRIHTGEKKYVCEECGVAVVTSSSLAKHKRIHNKVKPHVCDVCGKGFIVRGRLIEHIRLHTGERPFVCEICRKSFTMRDKLKRHVRTHIEHKPYSCEICGRGYSTNHGLSIHLKSHSSRNQVRYSFTIFVAQKMRV